MAWLTHWSGAPLHPSGRNRPLRSGAASGRLPPRSMPDKRPLACPARPCCTDLAALTNSPAPPACLSDHVPPSYNPGMCAAVWAAPPSYHPGMCAAVCIGQLGLTAQQPAPWGLLRAAAPPHAAEGSAARAGTRRATSFSAGARGAVLSTPRS